MNRNNFEQFAIYLFSDFIHKRIVYWKNFYLNTILDFVVFLFLSYRNNECKFNKKEKFYLSEPMIIWNYNTYQSKNLYILVPALLWQVICTNF